MPSGGSITALIGRIKEGDSAAVRQLWEIYCPLLQGIARKKLPPLGIGDEEDVVQSALWSFFTGAAQGEFSVLKDREDLWSLLTVITSRKAINLLKHEKCPKRNPQQMIDGKRWPPDNLGKQDVELVLDSEPAPDLMVILDEESKRLLDSLGDRQLRSITIWRLEGYTEVEIAAMLGCTLRTVERKLRLIRKIWSRESANA
jgi:RNA polymerase sigma factor (sigma-70 family)